MFITILPKMGEKINCVSANDPNTHPDMVLLSPLASACKEKEI